MTPRNAFLLDLAQWLLFGGFAAYLIAFLLYVSGTLGRRISGGTRFERTAGHGTVANVLGVTLHGLAILARWQGSGFWPTSNMYEFIGFMAFSSMVAFLVLHRMYRLYIVGALVTPVTLFLLAYSYVFPPEVTPLIPALQSIWLPLHVSLAALGEGFFAVAFGAALLYLLRVRGLELARSRAAAEAASALEGGAVAGAAGAAAAAAPTETADQRWERLWGVRLMEVLFYIILVMVGFTLLALIFRWSGFQWIFASGSTYHLPPIIGPWGAEVGEKGSVLGVPLPAVVVPFGWRGKHLNTLLYSLAVGGLLYWAIRRFVARGRIGDALAVRVGGDPELLDEISYRAVAIGYPIFTLGGLIFAMIWAKEAWGRYWFWDPKETWALIAWLVYSAYLHFRISRGWEGRKSAWLAVLGFGVVLFTLVGVNLLIVGLHSYAGGD
ncbi:ABC-type transport system involved in cytochrome c biogenesis permease subunit [Symbiobacterium terraclitae]|uniref:ABC-type transport system involved in cytochrome c biogenesis permease subunit n=1 Tax=Symbiobacterium terraclitae TaxID=557451 RepID=A0ABS4JMP8_9FIRM|nr:cytochrome c biogenesis protein CcsA [Symbiobacterium terraclitae]MBP2016817.1 ABC-type transport system involved in cytochrome c biogenesis permease subunit [Symbiobacterium terraclitae]